MMTNSALPTPSALPNRPHHSPAPALGSTSAQLSGIVLQLDRLAAQPDLPRDLARQIELLTIDAGAVGRAARERESFLSGLHGGF